MIGDGESAWTSICMRSSSPRRAAASYIAAPRLPRVPPPERIVSRPSASAATGAWSRYCPAPANASIGKKWEWRSMFISLRAPEVRLEEIESPAPRLFRRLGVIAVGCGVGMKAVLRAGIYFIAVGLVVFMHRRDGAGDVLIDAGIFLAVVRQHRRLDVFHGLERRRAAALTNHQGR